MPSPDNGAGSGVVLTSEKPWRRSRTRKLAGARTFDGALGESDRAKIKVMVKRILRKHGYPPGLQDEAVKTVLAQAELLCAEWVA